MRKLIQILVVIVLLWIWKLYHDLNILFPDPYAVSSMLLSVNILKFGHIRPGDIVGPEVRYHARVILGEVRPISGILLSILHCLTTVNERILVNISLPFYITTIYLVIFSKKMFYNKKRMFTLALIYLLFSVLRLDIDGLWFISLGFFYLIQTIFIILSLEESNSKNIILFFLMLASALTYYTGFICTLTSFLLWQILHLKPIFSRKMQSSLSKLINIFIGLIFGLTFLVYKESLDYELFFTNYGSIIEAFLNSFILKYFLRFNVRPPYSTVYAYELYPDELYILLYSLYRILTLSGILIVFFFFLIIFLQKGCLNNLFSSKLIRLIIFLLCSGFSETYSYSVFANIFMIRTLINLYIPLCLVFFMSHISRFYEENESIKYTKCYFKIFFLFYKILLITLTIILFLISNLEILDYATYSSIKENLMFNIFIYLFENFNNYVILFSEVDFSFCFSYFSYYHSKQNIHPISYHVKFIIEEGPLYLNRHKMYFFVNAAHPFTKSIAWQNYHFLSKTFFSEAFINLNIVFHDYEYVLFSP